MITRAAHPCLFALAAVCLVLGCGTEGGEEQQANAAERCEAFIANMAVCQPDLATEARCTEDTLKQIDELGLAEKPCDEVQKAGKADWFSFGGCDEGEHVCGWLFCCDDYVITWFPKAESDWDIIPVIEALQAGAPAKEMGIPSPAQKLSRRFSPAQRSMRTKQKPMAPFFKRRSMRAWRISVPS